MKFDIVTLIIIGATCLVSFKAFKDYLFFDKFKFLSAGIQRGEHYRMLTSGLLHVDIQHLFFNMLTLLFFAHTVVFWGGDINFLVVYIGSLIGGSLLSYIMNKNNYMYSAVGASGAVSGIIYSAILIDPNLRVYFGIPGFVFGIGYLIYSIIGMKRKTDNIGHDAHIGGAAAGLLLTLAYDFDIALDRPLIVAGLLVPIIVLFVLIKLDKI